MIARSWRTILASILLSLTLLISACSYAPPSPYDQVQEDTSGKNAPPAVVDDAEKGGTFNKFFPGSQGDYQVVPAQEKQGFAQYKVNRDGTNVAVLSINDTISNPEAAQKFEESSQTIAGYPSVEIGSNQTAILVSGRYQVKVQSRDASFTPEDREAWLMKFDLNGLSQLQALLLLKQPAA